MGLGARYSELIDQYKIMHNTPSMFDGKSLPVHGESISELISELGIETVMDYGCGKGNWHEEMEEMWEIPPITPYDPAFAPFSTKPHGKFDLVICTDVLEHCDKQDLPWIVDEICDYSTKAVYLAAASYPAAKTLPNGENAHCTIEPIEWWSDLFRTAQLNHPNIVLKCTVSRLK